MITKHMQILDIVEKYPKTQEIFPKYDEVVGTCIMCSHLFQTISDIESEYGMDLGNLVVELNAALEDK